MLRQLCYPLPMPTSQSMHRHQKAMFISNTLEDEFFCGMGLGVGSNKAKTIFRLLPSP